MKKKMFTNQVDSDLLKSFKKLAIDLDRPINNVLEEAMRNLLKNHEKPNKKRNILQLLNCFFKIAFLIVFYAAFSESSRLNDLCLHRMKL